MIIALNSGGVPKNISCIFRESSHSGFTRCSGGTILSEVPSLRGYIGPRKVTLSTLEQLAITEPVARLIVEFRRVRRKVVRLESISGAARDGKIYPLFNQIRSRTSLVATNGPSLFDIEGLRELKSCMDERRDYGMTIGIERTHGGRLWAAWVAGGNSDLGYFVAASSDDEGRTWSKPHLVIDPPEAPTGLRRRLLVGNFWCDPTRRLWLFFDQSMGMRQSLRPPPRQMAAPATAASQVTLAPRAWTHIRLVFGSVTVPSPLLR